MATDTTSSIVPLVQPRRPKTSAERQRAYKARLKERAASTALVPITEPITSPIRVIEFPPIAPAPEPKRHRLSPAAIALRAAALGLDLQKVPKGGGPLIGLEPHKNNHCPSPHPCPDPQMGPRLPRAALAVF